MAKTIKEIAAEIGVSKQAVYKRYKGKLYAACTPYAYTKCGVLYLSEQAENIIKQDFLKDRHSDGAHTERSNGAHTERSNGAHTERSIGAVLKRSVNEHISKKQDENTNKCDCLENEHSDGAHTERSNGAHTERSNGAHTERSNGAHTERSNGAHTERSNGAHTEPQENDGVLEILRTTIDTLQEQLRVKDRQIEQLSAALVAAQQTAQIAQRTAQAEQALHAGTMQQQLADSEDRTVEAKGRRWFTRWFRK